MSDLVKLKEVCIKITDGSHYSPKGTSDGFPMLSVKDMLQNGFDTKSCKYISRKDFEDLVKADCKPLKNDILIAKDGSYLKHVFVVIEEKDEVILSSIGILRPNLLKIDPYYLKYYLHTNSVKETVSKKYVSGSALPRIILKNFGEIEIIKRPLIDQQKIASVLSALDDKIELNNKINAELEAMAKLIYDYWFVQFDFPFDFKQNKVAEESSNPKDVKPYKSSGGKMVYNEKLKREIPEGWEVKKLKEIAKTGSGGTPLKSKREFYNDATIPWINSGEVNMPFITKAEKFITEIGLKNSSARIFPKGTILMAMYGATAGKVSLMDIEACTNQAVCGINPIKEHYSIFIKFGLEEMYQYLVNLSSGSARDNLSQDIIRELRFAFPADEVVKSYHEKVNPFLLKILNNMKQNQQLAELRDWLLPMLMNGQVKVKDACEKMEEVGMAAEGDEGV